MQPAPSEASQIATSASSSSIIETFHHHGLQPTNDQASSNISSADVVGGSLPTHEDADDASIVSSSTRRGRRLDTRRLSGSASSSQESSPGSRIDEYERAHINFRKPSDGMIFQIVPTAAGKQNSISILDFPNEVLTHVLSHLPPETLSMMSLVSRRFHKRVTTPPAWRIAFARYFPGSETALIANSLFQGVDVDTQRSERRYFTRLSALASWRSEYILRTRLLRSVERGRPALQTVSKSGSRHGKAPIASVVTYGSGLLYPVSHIHASFGVGLNKKQPLFMHGALEQGAVSTSDPSVSKIGQWGMGDFENFKHFEDVFVGEAEYGLGLGNVVGMPNVMDLSQPYGKIYGEACPGGRLFFTSTAEQRGRFLPIVSSPNHDLGIPDVTMLGCAVTSVWISKSEGVLKATNGVFGCLAGFSNGVLAAYALGVNPVHDRRFAHGEPTAKWAFCPGVPIIAIVVDENINSRRLGRRKVWATVLNALGEVFYLTDLPTRPEFKGKSSVSDMDRLAWQTGRTVEWFLIESTRRIAKADPFNVSLVDGSYSPRSSGDAQGLSKDQLIAETKEIEKFLAHTPKHFRSTCEGWDMRRKLVVDFAGDDHLGGGESIFIIACGLDEGAVASIKRISRRKVKATIDYTLDDYPSIASSIQRTSVFGDPSTPARELSSPSPWSAPRSRTSSHEDLHDFAFKIEWYISNFTFGNLRGVQISTVATDDSDFATLAVNEDPTLGMSGVSNTSSPVASPLTSAAIPLSPSEIPGHRARFLAVGTTSGVVLLWNMRASISPAADVVNTVQPSRYIYTKSPQISSLALTALYVVHGGNDGLVQAWDPLASSLEPIRTLNSQFSNQARRRIAQAEASTQGVGKNYYAAGAIVLDPDPTVLRGMVSLGTHLRYWSYSASAADSYKSRKRGQLRHRSERGSNSAPNEQKFHHTGRSVLKDYIQNEKQELEFEKVHKRKEMEKLTGRFGTNLLGEDASEEEILAYATMLSEEAFAKDEERLNNLESSTAATSRSSMQDPNSKAEPLDADLEEAIRLSLLDTEYAAESPQRTDLDIPIKYARRSKHGTPVKNNAAGRLQSPHLGAEEEDLNFALRLSLAEQESRLMDESEFPVLSSSPDSESQPRNKGKGKSKRY